MRIGLSVPQVGSVLFAMVSITIIDIFLFRGAKAGEVRWGRIPAISQYVLIFIAVGIYLGARVPTSMTPLKNAANAS